MKSLVVSNSGSSVLDILPFFYEPKHTSYQPLLLKVVAALHVDILHRNRRSGCPLLIGRIALPYMNSNSLAKTFLILDILSSLN